MPLPLLLIPVVAAASGTSISAIIGAVLGGGLGGAGVASAFWWFFSERPEPSQAHQESLNTQIQMTQERIIETKKAVESIQLNLMSVNQSVQNAITASACSVNTIQRISDQLDQTKNQLIIAIQGAKEANEQLEASQELYKTLEKQTQSESLQTTTKLEELNTLLKTKSDELIQVNNEIKQLRSTLETQTDAIKTLEEAVKTVTEVNKEQALTIDKQQKKIELLEPLVERLTQQNRFFKQVAQQSMTLQPANSTPTPSLK